MSNDLRVRILDVGQGDAIVGLLPGTPRAFVVDVCEAKPVLDLLHAEAIEEIILYLSHSDRDHTHGAIDLLNTFKGSFRGIYFNQDRWAPKPNGDYYELLRAIAKASRAIEQTSPRSPSDRLTTNLNTDPGYMTWFGPSVRVIVIHPTSADLLSLANCGQNAISGVLLIEHDLTNGVRRTLLTADIELTGISLLLNRTARQPVAADVLKFPHHGAWPLTYPGLSACGGVLPRPMADFLAAVAPQAVVVSAGFANSHGHVRQEAFNALRDYHATSKRLVHLGCTQFTPTCLRQRVIGPDLATPDCAGDVEIRTGNEVGTNGLMVTTVGGNHADRIHNLMKAGGAPQCGFLPIPSKTS